MAPTPVPPNFNNAIGNFECLGNLTSLTIGSGGRDPNCATMLKSNSGNSGALGSWHDLKELQEALFCYLSEMFAGVAVAPELR